MKGITRIGSIVLALSLVAAIILIPQQVTSNPDDIAKVGTDTSGTSSSGTVKYITFSHTLVSGSNRMVVVYAGQENNGNSDITSITYGGTAMTLAVENATGASGYIARAEIWYMLESQLAALGDGAKTVNITCSAASSSEINGFAAEYTGVYQGVPEATAKNMTNAATPTTLTNYISPTAGAWVMSTVYSGATGTGFAHGQSQVELLDFADGSSRFGVAELRNGYGNTSITETLSGTSLSRMTYVSASFNNVDSEPEVPCWIEDTDTHRIWLPDGCRYYADVGEEDMVGYI